MGKEIKKYRFKNFPFTDINEIYYVNGKVNERVDDIIKQFDYNNDETSANSSCDFRSKIYETNGRVFWDIPYLIAGLVFNDDNKDRDLPLNILCNRYDNSYLLEYLEDHSQKDNIGPALIYRDNEDIIKNNDDGIVTMHAIDISDLNGWLDLFDILLNIEPIHAKKIQEVLSFKNLLNFADQPLLDYAYGSGRVSVKNYSLSPDEIEFIYSLDDKIREKISKSKDKAGFYAKLIQGLEKYKPRMSLEIHKDYSIHLPECDNEELKLSPVLKSFYFLYLRHPEGIRYEDLCFFQTELTRIYSKILGHVLSPEESKSIKRYTEERKMTDQARSKIKAKLRTKLKKENYEPFIIEGKRGDQMKIVLAKDSIKWDCQDIESIPLDKPRLKKHEKFN